MRGEKIKQGQDCISQRGACAKEGGRLGSWASEKKTLMTHAGPVFCEATLFGFSTTNSREKNKINIYKYASPVLRSALPLLVLTQQRKKNRNVDLQPHPSVCMGVFAHLDCGRGNAEALHYKKIISGKTATVDKVCGFL